MDSRINEILGAEEFETFPEFEEALNDFLEANEDCDINDFIILMAEELKKDDNTEMVEDFGKWVCQQVTEEYDEDDLTESLDEFEIYEADNLPAVRPQAGLPAKATKRKINGQVVGRAEAVGSSSNKERQRGKIRAKLHGKGSSKAGVQSGKYKRVVRTTTNRKGQTKTRVIHKKTLAHRVKQNINVAKIKAKRYIRQHGKAKAKAIGKSAVDHLSSMVF